MTTFLAVTICKLVRFVGVKVGRGSSLPGKITLKLFPHILKKIKLPKLVIAVSGSNGKTSTVEMIGHVMQQNDINVIWNKEGSNQIEGVTTFLLSNCNGKGEVKAEAVLLESDERYARLTFANFTPTHFVITNLYRDQMTRNAHSEWIFDILKDAVKPETMLILNANDPFVSCFALGHDRDKTEYFSIDENRYSTKEVNGIYNDGRYCPNCKAPLSYEYYNMAHIGKFCCHECGLKTEEARCRVTSIDLNEKKLVFDGEYEINLNFASLFNVYNILATYTLADVIGLDRMKTVEALNGYILKKGRIVEFDMAGRKCMLLTSKHENSVSYDQSIDYVKRFDKSSTVVFLVDAISRKYYTSETSWLFDINFDALRESKASRIILSGKYAFELATRFEFAGIDNIKIDVIPNIDEMMNELKKDEGGEQVFFITCFSDRDKIFQRTGENKK